MNKMAQAKIQKIVASHHQQVIIHLQGIQGKLNIPNGAQTCFIGGSAVIYDNDILEMLGRPIVKMHFETMIGYNRITGDNSSGFQVVN